MNINKMPRMICLLLWTIFCCLNTTNGRIHKLMIKNDNRKAIALSTFGFYKEGILDVKLTNFHTDSFKEEDIFGFTLDRSLNDAINPYLDPHLQERCLLEDSSKPPAYSPLPNSPSSSSATSSSAVVYFIMNRKTHMLHVNCSEELSSLRIYKDRNQVPTFRSKRDSLSDQTLFSTRQNNPALNSKSRNLRSPTTEHCMQNIPLEEEKPDYYKTNFVIYVPTENEQGLYNLYFHSCPNYKTNNKVEVDFIIEIEEKNNENYLSAGEMPLPALYFMMSILFFLSGCFWVFILVKSNHTVFKIHYLMAILVYLKSLSLLFHAINFHFIETKGEHVAAWAILFYITHLLPDDEGNLENRLAKNNNICERLKGSVLFITIVLIGTGWTFIKHLLSERDKKIFMIVIPLQVLANVVKIIIEESEEGDVEHRTWLDIFMLVDLLCCGAILFPVVWSIRYLQDASTIDGKAAINLRKLKLFRHFYIMIVCYIYFTRIIVYLLQMTVSFQYEWLDEMFREMVTYVFFVLTGYKFRPASANPYFQVNTDDDEEVDIVLCYPHPYLTTPDYHGTRASVSQCGVTEGISKLSRMTSDQNEEETEVLLLSKRESSHEYD